MSDAARNDTWQAGDSYDSYIGRWSRQIAPRFLDWLDPPRGRDWLEVGCGTGALMAAILAGCDPRSVVAIEPSEEFLAKARANVQDGRVVFQVGNAQALPAMPATADVIVSGLVLNFVPDRDKALAEMKRVGRPGATVAFYVWDYPGGGLEFGRAFWAAASLLDPRARQLVGDQRFPFCTPGGLTDLVRNAGLASVDCAPIEVPAVFKDFEDYWNPFTLGAGPAPGYCMSLDPDARQRLKERLEASLPRSDDGSIPMKVRAWALKAIVT